MTAPSAPLVGREREMSDLRAALEAANAGRGAFWLVHGEPGIGKTKLADELADEARASGATVLWGRCWEGGGAPAFWPWSQAIRTYTRDMPSDALDELLGSERTEVAQIVPELGDGSSQRAPPLAEISDAEGARFRLFDATTTFLKRAAAARPILLVLDDLHAADKPSLLLLRFLARDIKDARIFVYGTFRDVDAGQDPEQAAALADLAREAHSMPLGGLRVEDVARYVADTAGSSVRDAIVQAVFDLTEGNPLFVSEVVRLLAAERRLDDPLLLGSVGIPQGVREVIGRRIDHLTEDCRAVLVVASALGRDFELGVLERVSTLTADQLLNVLQEAIDAAVVTQVPGPEWHFRFSHALIRETLYGELRGIRRVRLHRQIAEALEDLYARDPEPHLDELAHHFVQAAPLGGAGRAIDYAARAGDRASASLAHENAVLLYQVALTTLAESREPDDSRRCALLLALGEAQMRSGAPGDAKQTLLAAAVVARAIGSPERLAHAALWYGSDIEGIGWAVQDETLVGLLEESLAALDPGDGPLRARLMGRLAMARYWTAPRESVDRLSRAAIEMAEGLDEPAALASALISAAHVLWGPGDLERRADAADQIVRLAAVRGDREMILRGLRIRLGAALELGDRATSDVVIDAHEALAKELRHPLYLGYSAQFRALIATMEGRFDDAMAIADRALEFYERAGNPFGRSFRNAQMLVTEWLRGNLPTAGQENRRMRATLGHVAEQMPAVRTFFALLDFKAGDERSARSSFEQLAAKEFADHPRDVTWLSNLRALASLCCGLGDERRARILHGLYSPYHSRMLIAAPPPLAVYGPVAHSLGLLAQCYGDFARAASYFEEAVGMEQAMGARPFLAETQAAYAHLLETEDQDRATDMAASAFAIAEELGMADVAAEAKAILGAHAVSAVAPIGASAEAAFRHEGEFWTVSFEGSVFRLKDTKGARYLSALLLRPGREIHVSDLVGLGSGAGTEPSVPAPDESEAMFIGQGDAGELLDEDAKTAYKHRLVELEAERDEARSWGDAERAARAKEEIEAIAGELARAVGLGGRDRRAASAAERARQSVTRAVRSTIERIAKANPALGRHLEATVRTGVFCCYAADPRSRVAWRS